MADLLLWAAGLEIFVGALAVLLGLVVFSTGRTRGVNVFLAVYLVINGIGPLGVLRGAGRLLKETEPSLSTGVLAAAQLGDLAWPGLYLVFGSLALRSPVLAPFRNNGMRAVVLALPVVLGISWWYLAGTGINYEVYDSILFTYTGLAVGINLIAAIHDWKTSDADHRTRARLYLVSFGTIDLAYLASAFTLAFFPAAWNAQPLLHLLLMMAMLLAGFGLLTYTVLKGHLVDLDRHIHFGISKTTVGAIFVGTFIALQEILSELATATAGYVVGGIATFGLVFALAPIQKMANKVANQAVPSMQPRHMGATEVEQIYREQVEVAWEDGGISAKDVRSLGLLRKRLGIAASVAGGIEVEVRERVQGPGT